MVELPAAADIRCSAETIFELIIDFPGQARWLTKSSAFHGTNEVSSGPVGLGTTYTEPGPFGVRHGEVTEFERPTKVTFHQPMTLKLHSGTLDVTVRYTLTGGLIRFRAFGSKRTVIAACDTRVWRQTSESSLDPKPRRA